MRGKSYIPKGYGHIDFVADCYFENSIKASERFKRIYQLKLSLNLVKSKIPRDYVETHSYYVEKIRLIELIFQTMEDEKDEILP